jgi:hypothetical protein
VTNWNRSNGRSLIDGHYRTWSAWLSRSAITTEMFRGAVLTTRFDGARVGALSREFACSRRTLGNFGRATGRERHCTLGIGIAVCYEYTDTAGTRDQPANREHNESAAEVGDTKVAKLGMQHSGHNNLLCAPKPCSYHSQRVCSRKLHFVLKFTNVL